MCANYLDLIGGQGDTLDVNDAMTCPNHHKTTCEYFIPTWVEAFSP